MRMKISHLTKRIAPGSQNGFDNSGKFGPIAWQQGDTTKQTLTAIQNLADRYAKDTDVVTAIELLNEPGNWGLDMSQVKQFYYDGWGNVRTDDSYTSVVIHDAFLDIQSYWNGFMNYQSGVNDVILDTHIYQIFSNDQVAMKPCEHVQTTCAAGPKVAGTDKWLVVGEWTGAQTMELIRTVATTATVRTNTKELWTACWKLTRQTWRTTLRHNSMLTRCTLDGSSGHGRQRAHPSGISRI
jgi:aryl-phospho-beta-D-glucosidase BglC (GH1 family)